IDPSQSVTETSQFRHSLSTLSESERRQPQKRPAPSPPAALDRIDERGRSRRQAADERPAAREYGHPEARGAFVRAEALDVGREAACVECPDDRDRREVRMRLGEAEPIEALVAGATPQHE